MARRRSPGKGKSSSTDFYSPSCKTQKRQSAHSDWSNFIRVCVLVVIVVGICGFLFYPDILRVIAVLRNTVTEQGGGFGSYFRSVKENHGFGSKEANRNKLVHGRDVRSADDNFQQEKRNNQNQAFENYDPNPNESLKKVGIEQASPPVPNENTLGKDDRRNNGNEREATYTKQQHTAVKNNVKSVDSDDPPELQLPPRIASRGRKPGDKGPIILNGKNSRIILDTKNLNTESFSSETTQGNHKTNPKKSSKSSKVSGDPKVTKDKVANGKENTKTRVSTKGPSKQISSDTMGKHSKSKATDTIASHDSTKRKFQTEKAMTNDKTNKKGGSKESSNPKPSNPPIKKENVAKKTFKSTKEETKAKSSKKPPEPKSATKADGMTTSESQSEDNFQLKFQKSFTPKKIFDGGRRIPPVHLIHQKKSNSSVRAYLFDDFLSAKECDGLMRAHDNHVAAYANQPILCFDSVQTLRGHLKDAGKDVTVTPTDFTEGTTCINSSFSAQVQSWFHSNWSYSTAFYPGESPFSKNLASRIERAMGLDPDNGGKFQITSYPQGKAYKTHTDCTLGGSDQRDRVVSVLIYLGDVEQGGETKFPDLGIWVKPRKGRALVWNNMSPQGVCEPDSRHVASVVKKGNKYILIRWYYYKNFPSLGHRPDPPPLPQREARQAMVMCDEYHTGSCRWYDEWSYNAMVQYNSQTFGGTKTVS